MEVLACSKLTFMMQHARRLQNYCHSCFNFSSRALTRHISFSAFSGNFVLFPDVFTEAEQCTLLTGALQKLDSVESRHFRRQRREYLSSQDPNKGIRLVQNVFLPDEFYGFAEGHYDGVIRRFREMHVSSWPTDQSLLGTLLERMRTFQPTVNDTQTHILHLASDGEILPHVDNLGASGKWILGVSLGAPRILRLEDTKSDSPPIDIMLPSGSLYVQKNDVRFNYKHSILRRGSLNGILYDGGQRLTILVRDRLPVQALGKD